MAETLAFAIIVIFLVAISVGANRRGAVRRDGDIRSAGRKSAPTTYSVPTTNAEPRGAFDQSTSHPPQARRKLAGRAWVTDGDTITIEGVRIRLFGIDAPELDHPHGRNAKWALHRLCKGQTVHAEILSEDAYGRTVARCSLSDGTDLSAEIVKQGLALDWRKFSGGVYRHLETHDARRKLFLADARQKGRMDVWKRFEANQNKRR